ncbi:MAG: MFS transporter [Haloarculaceae archaeon]
MTASERSETERERLFTGETGRLSVALGGGLLAVNFGRQAIPPLLPAIVADLGITPSQAGFALTAFAGAFAAVQYLSGQVADELSRKTVLVGSLSVVTVGLLALSAVSSYPMLVASTTVVGLGSGGYLISMRVSLSDLFVERRGEALGLNTAAGQLGNVMAAGLAAAALALATWRAAFLPVALIVVVVAVALHVWGHDAYAVGRVDLELRETVRRILATRRIRWLLLAYTLVIFTWQGVVGFLPTVLQAEKGLSPTLASGGFALLFAVGMVVQPVSGRLSDRFSRTAVAGSALVVGALGVGLLVLTTSLALLGIGIAMLAAGMMTFPPVVQAYLLDVFPDSSVGGDFGAFRTMYKLLASLGPTYVGVVAERASYGVAFAGFGGCLLAGAVILLVLPGGD